MKSKPTIGFVITCHYSDDIRPDGQRFLDRLLTSIDRYVESNHKIYIIDNGSDKELKYTNSDKIHYTKITDQFELGLTGAWNIGLDLAAKDNCDIIIQCNDDLWFNQTINIFIDTINNDSSFMECMDKFIKTVLILFLILNFLIS